MGEKIKVVEKVAELHDIEVSQTYPTMLYKRYTVLNLEPPPYLQQLHYALHPELLPPTYGGMPPGYGAQYGGMPPGYGAPTYRRRLPVMDRVLQEAEADRLRRQDSEPHRRV